MAELNRSDLLKAKREGVGIVVRVTNTKGSSPRSAGSAMLVEKNNFYGTIGGGQAEWLAIKRAREILSGSRHPSNYTLTLGPEIGQCCGGIMELEFMNISTLNIEDVLNNKSRDCLIFGAGHTGLALARAFDALDFKIRIFDTREDYSEADKHVEISSIPEKHVRDASAGSIFIVTTHDHGLDFLITSEALKREDAAYVGMIGSKSKRAGLKNWMDENGYVREITNALYCPIGCSLNATPVDPKRPAVIAAMTLVEVLGALENL